MRTSTSIRARRKSCVPPPGAYGGPYAGPYAALRRPMPGRSRASASIARTTSYDRGYAPGPRRYSYAEPAAPYAGRCAPRELVKERLYRDGWRDFHDGDARGDIATVRARRPSGRLFELTLDRCSGEIVRPEPLEGPPFRSLCLRAPAAALGQGLLKALAAEAHEEASAQAGAFVVSGPAPDAPRGAR